MITSETGCFDNTKKNEGGFKFVSESETEVQASFYKRGVTGVFIRSVLFK